jgi:hypothetical protein
MKNSLLLVFLVQLTFGFAQEKFEISSAKKFQKRSMLNMLILKQVR